LGRRKNQIIIILTLVGILTLINLDLLVVDYDFRIPGKESFYYSKVYPYLDIVITSALPFLVMFTANVVSVVLLKHSKTKSKAMSNINRGNRFIIVTVSLNALFLITYVPNSCMQLWGQYRYSAGGIENLQDFYKIMIGNEFFCIASHWKILYSVFHVLIYYKGNKIFREELKIKLRIKKNIFKR
jgi:hypothetical protein